MDELGGRPHWGKRHFQTAATLRPRYPEWERFQAVRARLDPEGRFANDWTDRVLGPVDAQSTRPVDSDAASMSGDMTSSASRAGHRRAGSARSRSSTSTRSGPTPPTWNAAPRPSRSGWRASRCAAARCRNACSRGPDFAARSPSPCPRRCGSRRTGSKTSSSPIRPPIARALRELAQLTAERPETRVSMMVDSARAARPDRRASTGPAAAARPVRVCMELDAGCGCSAGACASAPSARPCTPPRRPPRSPARSSPARVSSSSG